MPVITRIQLGTSTASNPALSGVKLGNHLVVQNTWFDGAGKTAETTPTDSNGTVSLGKSVTGATFSGSQGCGTSLFYVENANSGTHTFTCKNYGAGGQHRTLTEWAGISKSGSLAKIGRAS